jgi:hypothetical protein
MVKKVSVDLCDEEIWVEVVAVMHLIMVGVVEVVVEVEVVVAIVEEVHHGLHGTNMDTNPVI